MNKELLQLLPINIIITSFNRVNFLERTINSINNNTVYPYKIFVVDNNSTDGSVGYLKLAKTQGKIFDCLLLDSNEGQSVALNKAFIWMQEWEKRRKSDNYFITTNEDILAPNLGKICWLTQLKHLFDKYEESHNVGSICLRIERTPRSDIDENKELIRMYKNIPSVFRMLKRDDFEKLGEVPFRKLNHYDSNSMATTMETRLQKKFYMATKLYASHIGWDENKGYKKGYTDYFTYSGEHKDNIHIEKPYPNICPKTFIPLKANHKCDEAEQKLRDNYWDITAGRDVNSHEGRDIEKTLLKEYVNGKTIDLGCGQEKISEECIGIDIYPFNSVDILHKCDDLWFFKDNEIDTIIASHILEHLADTKAVLKEWDRVLKRGGIMAIIIPNAQAFSKTILEPSHKVAITPRVMKRLFKDFLKYKIERFETLGSAGIKKDPLLIVGRKI